MNLAAANRALLAKCYPEALENYSRVAQEMDASLISLNLALCRNHCRTLSVEQPARSPVLSVACILDEFSSNSFSSCFRPCHLEPDCWREQFEKSQPDLFFCESAWFGYDKTRAIWAGKIYHQHRHTGDDNRKVLMDIVRHCKKEGIPTVFWNKEDPVYYDNPAYNFVATAKHFDYVFTTDAASVDSYHQKHGIKHVTPLPFATNPQFFNPLEIAQRHSNVVFAGGWYGDHTERCRAMRSLLDGLLAKSIPITIYDRYSGEPGILNRWPDKYQSLLQPSRPHHLMPNVYKSSRYGLNFNTVTGSPTMFSRRVFELMSCNTLVLSNYSEGTKQMFGDLVIYPEQEPERLEALCTKETDALRERALNEVLSKHTYMHRWKTILQSIGLPCSDSEPSLTYTVAAHNSGQAFCALDWFLQYGRTTDAQSRLLVVFSRESAPAERIRFEERDCQHHAVASITWESALQQCSQASQHPIKTTHFMLLRSDDYPTMDRIGSALLHLQYMKTRPLVLTRRGEERFRIGSTSVCLPLLDAAYGFAAALHCSRIYPAVYFV
jgi:spore maturation protein CgeB